MKAVLGIDTSAYTTSCALVDECGKVLADERRMLSVMEKERGLRQSEAVFQHLQIIPEVLKGVFDQVKYVQIVAVCASEKPLDSKDSYMPVFLVGRSFALGLSNAMKIPYFATTHQRGHLSAAKINIGERLPSSYLAVHLSGGTNQIIQVHENKTIEILFGSADISAGQLLDRVGVAMGSSFPAGTFMDRLANSFLGDLTSYPATILQGNIHFSGAEAAAYRDLAKGLPHELIAASLFDTIARGIIKQLLFAADKTGLNTVLITGGVASSMLLRQLLIQKAKKRKLNLRIIFGQSQYAGDNAVGVAFIGLQKLLNKEDYYGTNS